ncbi:MAG: hypothetical protein FWB96_08005 [Defluviitaleaceae bacterium]|nr:hypothetical protein [Defluviitaleaceae bacterium]MCL2262855.1 hypothetical protein [Defluviitaleaceae bacterium]
MEGVLREIFCTMLSIAYDFSSGTLNKKARVAFLNTQILNDGQNLRIGGKGLLPLQAVGGYPPTLLANNENTCMDEILFRNHTTT